MRSLAVLLAAVVLPVVACKGAPPSGHAADSTPPPVAAPAAAPAPPPADPNPASAAAPATTAAAVATAVTPAGKKARFVNRHTTVADRSAPAPVAAQVPIAAAITGAGGSSDNFGGVAAPSRDVRKMTDDDPYGATASR